MIAFHELIKIPTTKNSSLQSRPFPSLSNILKAISKPLCDSEYKREKSVTTVITKSLWFIKTSESESESEMYNYLLKVKVKLLLVCPLGAFQD